MHTNTLEKREETSWNEVASDDASVIDLSDTQAGNQANYPKRRGGFFRLITELRRRKVCRAATAYCIALWLTCQIVDVVDEPMGLPDWTLEFVIVIGLLGLPIALIMAWLFEVTPDGLILDHDTNRATNNVNPDVPRSVFDKVIDCSLLIVAAVLGIQLALTAIGPDLVAAPSKPEQIYVSSFPVVSGPGNAAFSDALQIQVQHELGNLAGFKVVAPKDPSKMKNGSYLMGSICFTDEEVQVTAVIVNNESNELTWSDVLRFPLENSSSTPNSIAKGLAKALENRPSADEASDG